MGGGGAWDADDNWLVGKHDEVRIYSRALSGAEVACLAGRNSPFSEPFDPNQDGTVNVKDFAILAVAGGMRFSAVIVACGECLADASMASDPAVNCRANLAPFRGLYHSVWAPIVFVGPELDGTCLLGVIRLQGGVQFLPIIFGFFS